MDLGVDYLPRPSLSRSLCVTIIVLAMDAQLAKHKRSRTQSVRSASPARRTLTLGLTRGFVHAPPTIIDPVLDRP